MDAHASPAEIEELLAHSAWLRALARRLVRDPALAEDLVQDTWHAALRSPRGAQRGWLATVLANLARARARGDSARRERERRSAEHEAVDGPDRLVERAEAQRNLLAHVLALAEPYRSTLLARFVEGRSAAEIARRTGVNESTVRTRLARALEQLRARLASEHREDEQLGLGVLLACPGAGGIAGGASGTALGALIVSTTTKLGLAAAVLLCAWLAWRSATLERASGDVELAARPEPAAALEQPARIPEQDRGRSALDQLPSAVSKPESAEPAAAPQPTRPTTTLDVVFTRDGAPVPGVAALLAPSNSPGWPAEHAVFFMDLLDARHVWPSNAPKAVSDARGLAAFRDVPPALYFVGFRPAAEQGPPTHFALGGTSGGVHPDTSCEIRLGTGAIHGTVFDDLGRPRANVGVLASVHQVDWHQGLAVSTFTVTDARGAFRLTDLRASDYDVVMEADARFDGRGEVQRRVIGLLPGEDRELDFGSSIPAPRWSGRLLNAFDEPFPGTARLGLARMDSADELSVQVDAEGKFQFAFAPGTWRIHAFAAGAPDSGFDLGRMELADTDVSRDLNVSGTRLHGRVTSATEGEELPKELFVAVHPKEHFYPAAIREISVSESGRYQIDGLDPGTWVVDIWPGALEAAPEVEILAGTRAIEQDLHWRAR